MPIFHPRNNRVLPSNARAADVARDSLNAIMPVQARRVDAAFQVNGYKGILYSYLTSGLKCGCQAKAKAINTRLNEDGKASPGAINQMMVGGPGFGVRPYGTRSEPTPAYVAQSGTGTSMLEVQLGANPQAAPVPLQSLFDESDLFGATRSGFGQPVRTQQTGIADADINATLITDESTSSAENVFETASDFDLELMGHSDVSCPICFGSGYVGGYSVMQGYRAVLNFQHPGITLPPGALIHVENSVSEIETESVTWKVLLPAGCVGVDALRLWNGTDLISSGFRIAVNGDPLNSQAALLDYCVGRDCEVTVTFDTRTEFTHLEIQLNQSDFWANFELPRQSKNSTQSLRESTDPFTIHLSPRVPTVKPLDVIVESTYGKALQCKTASPLNDRRFTTLGWNVEVRPTQPQELFFMLPRRTYIEAQNTRRMVIDNASPNATQGGFPRT